MRIADRWFDVKKIDDRISLLTEPHVCAFARCNIWHVRGKHQDMLVDFGMGIGDLKEALQALLDKPVIAVATHSHFDHIGSLHQFSHRCIHPAEEALIREPEDFPPLCAEHWPKGLRQAIESQGYEVPDILIDALPHADFDVQAFRSQACTATQLLKEGDLIDLGNSHYEVMHVPGHSPGSIALWDKTSGTLFSGDTLYDGPLLDATPDANIEDYLASMKRLRELPVNVVHAGHDPSFDRARLKQLTEQYLRSRA